MLTWKPVSIERFYRDHPHLLSMWKVLNLKEEAVVPISADSPIARSEDPKINEIVRLFKIDRNNFNPDSDWNHLMLVARAVGVENISADITVAFSEVLKVCDYINGGDTSGGLQKK